MGKACKMNWLPRWPSGVNRFLPPQSRRSGIDQALLRQIVDGFFPSPSATGTLRMTWPRALLSVALRDFIPAFLAYSIGPPADPLQGFFGGMQLFLVAYRKEDGDLVGTFRVGRSPSSPISKERAKSIGRDFSSPSATSFSFISEIALIAVRTFSFPVYVLGWMQ